MTKLTPLKHKDVLAIALPLIAANISTPLLGLADTAIVGRLGSEHYMGGVAVGATLLQSIFWAFSFLQMGTSGLTAQAVGRADAEALRTHLQRNLLLAGALGFAVLGVQTALIAHGLSLMGASAAVAEAANTYLATRIWAAPATFTNYVLAGWFIGRAMAKTTLLVQIASNLTNLILSLIFVFLFDWGIAGVAAGTLCAEIGGAGLGIALAARRLKKDGQKLFVEIDWAVLLAREAVAKVLMLNRDIFLRTFCLLIAFAFFTSQGARLGDTVLAANAILMQFIIFAAFFLDGFCLAVESLSGRAIGARSRTDLVRALTLGGQFALGTAATLSFGFLAFGGLFIHAMTTVEGVRAMAEAHLGWLVLTPLLSVWCFLLDGLFFGATRGPQMRNAAIIALASFLAAAYFLVPAFGSHGLWCALMIYYLGRTAGLAAYMPGLLASLSESTPTAAPIAARPSLDR